MRNFIIKPLTGLSLSFCIKDMIRYNVSVTDIEKIIAGTKAESDDDWRNILDSYKETYWSDYPEKAEQIFYELLKAGKIYQPRLYGKEIHSIAGGHWMVEGLYSYKPF